MSLAPNSTSDPLLASVQQAMQCHAAGRFDDARTIYQQVLAQAPDHPDALHLLGVLAAQQGDPAQAHALIWRAIAANPGEAMFHNNLANVCVELGRFDDAEPLYVRAIELDGARLDALSNLGLLLGRTGRPADAEKLLCRVVELAPGNPAWRQNLANLYLSMGREGDALQQCHDGLVVAPRSQPLRSLMVMAYTALGLNDKARDVLMAWRQAEPDNPFPRHHLAACTGQDVPGRAADDYITGVFDSFARSFDAKLADLSYQAPDLVAAEVARRAGPPSRALAVLDAGCGTGLCGPLLAPFAHHLTGVDLSEGMLRKAVDRQVYDDLMKGELVAFLGSQPGAYDLVASADTLCYFGALQSFSVAAQAALRGGGLLVFTVEAHDDAAGLPDFMLHGHGRYSQSRRYVESVLHGAGWVGIETQAVVLRQEGGKPVAGWLVSACAPPTR